MPNDTVLERFKKFKSMILSSNLPNNLLLEMAENFISSNDNDDSIVEIIPVLEGQLSLLDCEICA